MASLKNNLAYLLFSFFLVSKVFAQVRQFDLKPGNCQLFHGKLYCYGLTSLQQRAVFCLYKLNNQLVVTDSMSIELNNASPDNYLEITSDTLHDFLNIYLQKKEKKGITILRFNQNFGLVATIENVDVARLNNTSLFSAENLYFKNVVYSIKTVNDTSGKQFYINKYLLISETSNFDYTFKWQFPFERKNVFSAHLFFANQNYILVFVHVRGGVKSGQWILKIDSETGRLVKGIKLNSKGETSTYTFGHYLIDNSTKSFYLTGQKFTESQFNQNLNTVSVTNALTSDLYFLKIDSLDEIVKRQEFKIPTADIKTGPKKLPAGFLIKIHGFSKGTDGSFSLETDIYKNQGNSPCYSFCNSIPLHFIPGEDKLTLEKNSISPNILIEQYFASLDKLDMNGKSCIDSLNSFGRFFYTESTLPVKLQFKKDSEGNPVWILSKHTTKNNSVNYSFLCPVKKVYQLKTIEEINEIKQPHYLKLNAGTFLISWQLEEGKFQLKLYNW